jgi:hypothetical protein
VPVTDHVRVLFTVKEFDGGDKIPYRVFLSLEARRKDEDLASAAVVDRMSLWLKPGATYDDAKELANILNEKIDTAARLSFYKRDSAETKPS